MTIKQLKIEIKNREHALQILTSCLDFYRMCAITGDFTSEFDEWNLDMEQAIKYLQSHKR